MQSRVDNARQPLPLSEHELEVMVTRLLERREQEVPPEAVTEWTGPEIAAVVRTLGDPLLDEAEREAIWRRVLASGQFDAIVDALERSAEAAPNDTLAQAQLGSAYLHGMLGAANGPERGAWGAKGSAALERALKLDGTNWDARFWLARHYSYAEMSGDSLRHFEALLEVQETSSPLPKHAQTYLWLGNIHMDRGQRDETLRTWTRGLRAFPGDEALRARLDAFE